MDNTSNNNGQSNGSGNNDKASEQKVSFSLNLKPTKQTPFIRKPLNEDDEKPERDYITGMSGNKLVSAKPKEKKGPLVIPLSHGWRALPGDQNDLIKAEQNAEEKPVSEVMIKEEGASQATETFGDGSVATGTKVDGYGLQDEDDDEVAKRQAKQRLQAQKEAVKTSAGRDVSSIPPILRNLPAGIHDLNDEAAKFKFDLERRPESATSAEYDAVPVEQFGEALLRGMGWAPGAAIGGKITKVWEPEKRHHRLGLGAAPAPMIDPKKKGRMNITAMIGQPSAAAQQKGFKNGALVGIVSGPYDGLYAKITQLGGEKSLIKIVGQTDEMIVSHEDLTVVDPRKLGKDHPALQKDEDTHSDRHRDKHSSSHKHRDDDTKHKDKKRRTDEYEYERDKSSKSDKRDIDRHDKSKHHDKNGSDSTHKSSSSSSASAATPAPNWVTPEIRVKINSKSYRDGKYYGMKGRVIDILPGNKCSVVLEEYDRVLDDVDPKHMETVMPAAGGVIKVLVGPHKGHTGTLMERDNSKGTVQVQLHDDLSIQVLSMDDVAQFFGHVDV